MCLPSHSEVRVSTAESNLLISVQDKKCFPFSDCRGIIMSCTVAILFLNLQNQPNLNDYV